MINIYIYIHIIEFMYIYAPLYKPSYFGWCLGGASHSAGETLRTLPRRRARSGGTHCGPQGPPRGPGARFGVWKPIISSDFSHGKMLIYQEGRCLFMLHSGINDVIFYTCFDVK